MAEGQRDEQVRHIADDDAKSAPEQPDAQTDAGTEYHRVEQRKAKSATIRAEDAEAMHVTALESRIEVIQAKLNEREEELRQLLPRNAELEQTCRISKVLIKDGTIILAIGGGLISMAGAVFESQPIRYLLVGIGGGLLVCGLWIAKVLNRNIQPPGH